MPEGPCKLHKAWLGAVRGGCEVGDRRRDNRTGSQGNDYQLISGARKNLRNERIPTTVFHHPC